MTTIQAWGSVLALVCLTVTMKAAGPVLSAGARLPRSFPRFIAYLTPALLALLVTTQLLASTSDRLVVDARVAGFAAAVIAWRFKAPTMAVIVIAAGVTALCRL